jgi:ferredoxin--NADP+ reductase
LGIPGEDLLGSYSAAEIVPWYNGHPDFANFKVDLNSETAVVIGAGNVAMDVGRMFALDPHELDTTDTADHALAALHASSIIKTFICGRRGPEHAAFTAPELRELPKLEHTDVFLDAAAISEAQIRAEIKGEIEKDLRSNLEAMKTVAEAEKKGNARSLTFRFLSTPLEIRGDGKVEEIIFGINKVEGDTVIATGETYTIKCGIVVSAIGYEALHFDGLPYEKGRVLNNDGRVSENVYVVGWAKRGPSGVIGTNKSDASAVVELLVSELKNPKNITDIANQLKDKQIVDQSGWTKINAREVSEGESSGKPRRKMVDISEMINTATN